MEDFIHSGNFVVAKSMQGIVAGGKAGQFLLFPAFRVEIDDDARQRDAFRSFLEHSELQRTVSDEDGDIGGLRHVGHVGSCKKEERKGRGPFLPGGRKEKTASMSCQGTLVRAKDAKRTGGQDAETSAACGPRIAFRGRSVTGKTETHSPRFVMAATGALNEAGLPNFVNLTNIRA
jgi:hypothetical protein